MAGRGSTRGVALLTVLLLIIVAETLLLVGRFLGPGVTHFVTQPDTLAARRSRLPAAHGADVMIRLQNVRFLWSDKVSIYASDMAVRAVPFTGAAVDFDDLESFRLDVQRAAVHITPDVLAGMFNESIFSYPGSRVRDLKVTVVQDDEHRWIVRLDGHMNLLVPVPFTMFTHLSVDRSTNELVIDVDHLKAFGGIPATKLLRWTPLHLDRLIDLPPNKSVSVEGNRILVKPLGLFPPPRIDGRLASVEVLEGAIRIVFAGDAIAAPKSTARNYVYLHGGMSRFGAFQMVDTDILIIDAAPKDPFRFSLAHYAERIPSSVVVLPNMNSVHITMKDR